MRSRSALLSSLLVLAPTTSAQGPGYWEARPVLPTARQEVGAAALGGKLYCGGGLLSNRTTTATVEVFDPATAGWSRILNMPTPLHHFGMAAAGGKLYAIGGYRTSFSGRAECYAWNPATAAWSRVADLPSARGAFVAVEIAGKIYAVGGVSPGRGIVTDLTEYDPATNTWTTRAPMPTAREHLAAAALGGKLYVAGGRRGGLLFNQLECYDPATNTWTTLAPMPTARGGNGAAALDGKLVVMGGEGSSTPSGIFPQTEEYDPATNTWRSRAEMSVGLHGIYPVELGGEIVVAGGATIAGFRAVNTVIAFRDLPTGIQRYGASTPECTGTIAMLPSRLAAAGSNQFRLRTTPTAPTNAAAVLLLGAFQDLAGTGLLNLQLHVGFTPPLLLVPLSTSAAGVASLQVPVPATAASAQFFTQFVFVSTTVCPAGGPLAASDALNVTVQ